MLPPRVALIGCRKSKTRHPAPARELYSASALFRKTLAYVEPHVDEVLVLSLEIRAVLGSGVELECDAPKGFSEARLDLPEDSLGSFSTFPGPHRFQRLLVRFQKLIQRDEPVLGPARGSASTTASKLHPRPRRNQSLGRSSRSSQG